MKDLIHIAQKLRVESEKAGIHAENPMRERETGSGSARVSMLTSCWMVPRARLLRWMGPATGWVRVFITADIFAGQLGQGASYTKSFSGISALRDKSEPLGPPRGP